MTRRYFTESFSAINKAVGHLWLAPRLDDRKLYQQAPETASGRTATHLCTLSPDIIISARVRFAVQFLLFEKTGKENANDH